MKRTVKRLSRHGDAVVEFGVPSLLPAGVLVQFGAGWALMVAGIVWSAVGLARARWGEQ